MRPFLTLHHPAHARRHYADGLWAPETFYGLVARHARERPDAVALQDGRRQVTWRALRDWVDGVGADLRAQGLVGGDRVCVWMSNRAEAVVTFLACSREGFACNPSLHRTHTCAEIGTLVERLSARAFVTEPGWGADRGGGKLNGVLAGIGSLRAMYEPDTFPRAAANEAPPADDPDKVAYLAFTSGTTGAPKCVMHSDNTLLANGRELARDWNLDETAVILSLSPLSHHIAWVGVAQWVVCGGRFVTDDPPPRTSRLDWIVDTGATYVLGVPTHAMDILAEQRERALPRLGSVAVFYMAGAPIPPVVAQGFLRQGIKPQNIYGMTECSSHQYTHPDDDEATIVETCGRGGKAYEVRLFDPADDNRPVPAGTVGQIGGRGACLMLGYFDNQGATERSFNEDGWFMSGDLGVTDERGNLRIDGRLKDLIIRGGHNIYPSHIEAIALRSPAIDRVACIPVADERLGERVCICVLGTIEPDALLAHLAAEGLSKFDMPEFFVRMDAFPLTPSGKVLKRDLVDCVRRGDIQPTPVRYRAPAAPAPGDAAAAPGASA